MASLLDQLSSPSAGPWQEIEDLWRETVRARLWSVYYNEGTLHDYFNRFPVLKSGEGWRLLVSDYEALFPDKSGGLDELKASSEKIINLAKQKSSSTKDKFLRNKIAETLELCDGKDLFFVVQGVQITRESINNYTLWLA